MRIYKNYDASDVLLDNPCRIENLNLYPIRIKDYKRFQQYIQYICFSHEHLKIDYEEQLLPCIIGNAMRNYNKGKMPDKGTQEELNIYTRVVNDIADMFSLVCREEIKCNPIITDSFTFINKNNEIVVKQEDFDDIRCIILKQNIMFEPTIYESEMQKKWAEKVKRSRSRHSNSDLWEVMNLVSCEKHVTYADLSNYNILQLYADYLRLINTKEAETINLFKTVAGKDAKLPNINFSDAIFKKLYKNPDDDIFIDSDKHVLVQAMQ